MEISPSNVEISSLRDATYELCFQVHVKSQHNMHRSKNLVDEDHYPLQWLFCRFAGNIELRKEKKIFLCFFNQPSKQALKFEPFFCFQFFLVYFNYIFSFYLSQFHCGFNSLLCIFTLHHTTDLRPVLLSTSTQFSNHW